MKSTLFFVSAIALALTCNNASAKQPNILFILADDLGWSDTQLYGNTTYYQTPNIERLAKRGMTFTRAYSASPLCSPTRSAVLTGLSPARTGITTPNCHLPQVVLQATVPKSAAAGLKSVQPDPVTRLKTDYRTLAETLREAGYATGHFGKWHLGPEPYSPLQQGFDFDLPHHPGPGPAGSYIAPWKFKDFDHDPNVPDQHIEDRMAKEAVAWMEQHINQHKDKPFFMNYWMFSVHAPFDAKKALIEKHRARVDSNDQQRCPTYAAMIESMDDAVGTLLDALDRLKLADNTIIVFTSDNGGNMYSEVNGEVPTSNRPLRGGKASMFEGGTRVPCVVNWPGVTAGGSRNETLIQSEDYFPTVLDGLGIKPDTGQRFDGASVFAALKGDAVSRGAIFQYFPHSPPVPEWLPPSVSVHRGDWKLIRVFYGGDNGSHRYLLFNLRDDLSETQNLAEQKPDLVKELDGLIDGFLKETNAVTPMPNPAFDPTQYKPELEGKRPTNKSSASKTKPKAPSSDDNDPKFQGWKARTCSASVENGQLILHNVTAASFLGFSAAKHSGPTTISFRIKAGKGSSHVDWLPGGTQSKSHFAAYATKVDDWQEVSVDIASDGAIGIVRIYLPQPVPGTDSVQMDWIKIESQSGEKITLTEF